MSETPPPGITPALNPPTYTSFSVRKPPTLACKSHLGRAQSRAQSVQSMRFSTRICPLYPAVSSLQTRAPSPNHTNLRLFFSLARARERERERESCAVQCLSLARWLALALERAVADAVEWLARADTAHAV
eukprot:3887852-Rhodomonas_salina.3